MPAGPRQRHNQGRSLRCPALHPLPQILLHRPPPTFELFSNPEIEQLFNENVLAFWRAMESATANSNYLHETLLAKVTDHFPRIINAEVRQHKSERGLFVTSYFPRKITLAQMARYSTTPPRRTSPARSTLHLLRAGPGRHQRYWYISPIKIEVKVGSVDTTSPLR